MFKGDEQGIKIESLRELEIALGQFLAKNPLGQGGHRQEIESISLAFGALLKQVPDGSSASVGAAQALLAFLESQEHGNGACQKAGSR
jgi:hypothetical protein